MVFTAQLAAVVALIAQTPRWINTAVLSVFSCPEEPTEVPSASAVCDQKFAQYKNRWGSHKPQRPLSIARPAESAQVLGGAKY
jgi:hypothetical protein